MTDRHDEHVQGLRLFIDPSVRQQFKSKLEGRSDRRPKRLRAWSQVLANLDHSFDSRLQPASPAADAALEAWDVDRIIHFAGVETCYAASDDDELDDRILGVREALEHLARVQSYGTILSFEPGRLALYEQCELVDLRRWLRRSGPH